MMSKEALLREADALRDLARHTRRVVSLISRDYQKVALNHHADDFDRLASLLEIEAANAKTMPMERQQGLQAQQA